jgi:hypothetical protein
MNKKEKMISFHKLFSTKWCKTVDDEVDDVEEAKCECGVFEPRAR